MNEKKKVGLSGKQFLMVWLESLGWSGAMVMAYYFSTYNALIADVYSYDVAQIANLIAIMSFVGAFANMAGGPLADIFSIKANLTIGYAGMLACGAVCVFMNPSYGIMKIIAGLVSVFGLAFYVVPVLRYMPSLGSREQEGSIFGMFYGLAALNSLAIAPIASKIINSNGSKSGLIVITLFFCGLMVISWLAHILWIEPATKDNVRVVAGSSFRLADVAALLREPNFWLFMITCVFTVLPYDLNTFVQPLLKSEFETPQATIQFVSTWANNGTALVLAPLAGVIASKIGSTAKTISFSLLAAILSSLAMIFIPWEHKYFAIVVVIVFLLRGCFSIGKPMRNTICGESRLPKKYRGTALGLMFFVTGLQSTFIAKAAGSLTTTYGINKGYHILYWIATGLFTIGLVTSIIFSKKLAKAKEQDKINGFTPDDIMV